MNQKAIESKLEGLNIVDVEVKNDVYLLYNLIEYLSSTNRELQVENQRLRNEINRLKGEQEKPDIKPKNNGNKKGNNDISFEKERNNDKKNEKNKKNRESKVETIKTNRTEVCCVGAYRAEAGAEVVKVLVCNNAPHKLITENLGLCLLHEDRSYNKLMPIISDIIRSKTEGLSPG
ncbi:hypothetical protein MBAV_005508 [Candidatus Magnetobacterium bavaricum]|uniref:Uncharacterized protein n=1 Tax=Candidatus Magnetobacterium bavaricum TaxID=29290 RepID=A0A0F3GK87_9BACT|nr:hypothetical protein MBAV_005508 [Candidatus Magnetobacterium bavaricum]